MNEIEELRKNFSTDKRDTYVPHNDFYRNAKRSALKVKLKRVRPVKFLEVKK